MGNKVSQSEASSPSSNEDTANLEDRQNGVVKKSPRKSIRKIWPVIRICLLVMTVTGVVTGIAYFWTVIEPEN